MKKKGKTYKGVEPYKLSKPVKAYSKPPKPRRSIKILFLILVWIFGIAAIVLLILRYYHFFNEHKH